MGVEMPFWVVTDNNRAMAIPRTRAASATKTMRLAICRKGSRFDRSETTPMASPSWTISLDRVTKFQLNWRAFSWMLGKGKSACPARLYLANRFPSASQIQALTMFSSASRELRISAAAALSRKFSAETLLAPMIWAVEVNWPMTDLWNTCRSLSTRKVP